MDSGYYEKEILRHMDTMDSLNSKAALSNDNKELNKIVEDMGTALSNTEKIIKDYNIHNVMNNNSQTNEKDIKKRLSENKKRWKKLKEKLKLIKNGNNNSDDAETMNDEESSTSFQTLRMNSFNKLQHATRSTIEMENMSGNILTDLNNQTGQMKGVSSKIGLINEDMDSSNNILTKMNNRQGRDKRIIIFFSLFLILAFIGILSYKIINKFK